MRKTRRNTSSGGPAYDRKTIARLFSYMKAYRGRLLLVVVCILISAVAGAAGSLFLQVLIDDHIAALLVSPDPVFTGLLRALAGMAVIYLAGVAATLLYNRLMVTVAQGTLKAIRDDMFERMQRLPIRAFDTRTHGDIRLHPVIPVPSLIYIDGGRGNIVLFRTLPNTNGLAIVGANRTICCSQVYSNVMFHSSTLPRITVPVLYIEVPCITIGSII